jgi:hypothetical protein
MTIRFFQPLVLALMASVVSGCHTAHQSETKDRERSDIVHFTGQAPVWTFIPFSTYDVEDKRGYPAQIALPVVRDYSTNRIEVTVGGEVVSDGIVHLHRGGTLLQAISCAGGFTVYAKVSTVRVRKSSGEGVTLYLRWRPLPGGRYRQVRYDTAAHGESASDYQLEDGDHIYVSRALF